MKKNLAISIVIFILLSTIFFLVFGKGFVPLFQLLCYIIGFIGLIIIFISTAKSTDKGKYWKAGLISLPFIIIIIVPSMVNIVLETTGTESETTASHEDAWVISSGSSRNSRRNESVSMSMDRGEAEMPTDGGSSAINNNATATALPDFLQALTPRLSYSHNWALEAPVGEVGDRWDSARVLCLDEMQEYDCDIVSASFSGGERTASARISFMLLPAGVAELKENLTEGAILRQESLSAEDLSAQIYNLEMRIRLKEEDLALAIEQLETGAYSLSERRSKWRDIARMRAEISQLRFDATRLSDRARRTRVNVSWQGQYDPIRDEIEPSRLGLFSAISHSFTHSAKAAWGIVELGLVGFATMLPWIIIGGIFMLFLGLFIRLRNKNKA